MKKLLNYIILPVLIALITCCLNVLGAYCIYEYLTIALDILLWGIVLLIALILPILTRTAIRIVRSKNPFVNRWGFALITAVVDLVLNFTIFYPICDVFEIGWGNEMSGLLLQLVWIAMIAVNGIQIFISLIATVCTVTKQKHRDE